MTLHEIGLAHGSDKATAHKYLDFYESRIGTPKSILEFGVLNGASLKMWRDRYPGAVIIGLDIEEKKPIDGVYIFKIDASKNNWISKIKPKFDLILDDASHFTQDQIDSFTLWWPLVSTGGKYIIEDVHTMDYTHYNPNKIDLIGWVNSLNIKHEWYYRDNNDKSDSGTLIFYK